VTILWSLLSFAPLWPPRDFRIGGVIARQSNALMIEAAPVPGMMFPVRRLKFKSRGNFEQPANNCAII